MSLRSGVIRVVAGATKTISYYHNAERIVGRANHLSAARRSAIYLFYGVLAVFSLRCLLKGASLLAGERYLLEQVDFMMYLFESLGLNMGYFFQLICGIWLYSFVVYFLNLHHPDGDVWRHVYDLTCYNLNLFKGAVDYSSVDSNAQLVKMLRRDRKRGGRGGGSSGSGSEGPSPLDSVPSLTYYKLLPMEVRVKLLKWLVLSESFMFSFIWGALLIVFLSFIKTVENMNFAWASFLANVIDLISYFFMLIMLIQVSYICLFNNMLICYATVKEIGQLNHILSLQQQQQPGQHPGLQQQMNPGVSSQPPPLPPPLPPAKAAKAVGQRLSFVFRYHTSIVAFLNHYNRLYSKIIVFFMAGNVPSNCYVICYLLYATNHSTITKLCLLLVVEFQVLQLLGILLPVVRLNAAITSPSRWLYRLQMLKLMNSSSSTGSNYPPPPPPLGGAKVRGGSAAAGAPFRWSLKFKLAGYYELVTGKNAFMGITVPWFGRVKQWTVLEFVMMYVAYILKFTETFMKK